MASANPSHASDETGPLMQASLGENTPPIYGTTELQSISSGPSAGKKAGFEKYERKQGHALARGSVFNAVFPHAQNGPKEQSKSQSHHTKIYDILNPNSRSRAAIKFQQFISAVIIADCLIFIVSTEPDLADLAVFDITEAISSSIFLVEYVARLVVCTEQRRYAKFGPVRGRIHYLFSLYALIDALATFPFFLRWISGIPLPTLTFIRIFRLLRITRTNGYSKAMNALGRVFFFNREILWVTGLLLAYLVIFTSVLIYYLRPRGTDVDLVDDITAYNSIANTMVLSVQLITGQGGPSGKLPWYTQCAVLLAGTCSVAVFTIPSSMLTWGLDAEAQRLETKEKQKASSDSDARRSSISSDSSEDDLDVIEEEDDENQAGKQSDIFVSDMESGEDRALLHSLQNRMEKIELNAAVMNDKLDMLLKKIK